MDRRGETATVTELLSVARLITLTGPAGVGKTRLALQVAAQRSRGFPDGVWSVELAALADPALLAHTVAYAVGIRDSTADPGIALADFLRDRRLLLVLDNCEHLVEACASLAYRLLRAAEKLRILATSRETLRVEGEHVVPLEPLPVPDSLPAADVPGRGGQRGDAPAVELFAHRAAMVTPSFRVTEHNRRHVVEVCRKLDGLPLAIELAAARLREVPLDRLHGQLTDRFAVLDGGVRHGLPRQRSLRGAVEWSYELCDPAEQILWSRLSIFAGSADLESIEAVCTGGAVAPADLLTLLGKLVDKSILIGREQDGEVVYRMLDTLRAYGLGKLREAGEHVRLGQAHADRYLSLSERAERDWFGPRQAACLGWVRREHANLRVALEHYLSTGQVECAQRLGTALWFHWAFSGRATEGRLWVERALAQPGPPARDRAGALWTCSLVASQQGDLDATVRLAEAAYAAAVEAGDGLTAARAVTRLAIVAVYRQEPDRAALLVAEAMDRYQALGQADNADVVTALLTLNYAHLARGDLAASEELVQRCEAICRSQGDHVMLGNTLIQLSQREWLAGRLDRAAAYAGEAIRLAGPDTPAHALGQLIELTARIAGTAGDARRAATLLGAAEQVWRRFGLHKALRTPLFEGWREQCAATARRTLGDSAYEKAYRKGFRFTVSETIDYATAIAPSPSTARPSPGVLTRRERQVAELVAEGLSNKEIAWRLAIAQRTAESHVERIMTKLGLHSRVQIIAWVTGPGGAPSEVN